MPLHAKSRAMGKNTNKKKTDNGSRGSKHLQIYSVMALKFNYCIFNRNYNALLYLSVVPDLASKLRIIVLSSQYIQLSTTQLSKEEENKAHIVAFLKVLLLQNNTHYPIKCSPIQFLPQLCQEQAVLSKTPGFLLAPSCLYLTLCWHTWQSQQGTVKAVSR